MRPEEIAPAVVAFIERTGHVAFYDLLAIPEDDPRHNPHLYPWLLAEAGEPAPRAPAADAAHDGTAGLTPRPTVGVSVFLSAADSRLSLCRSPLPGVPNCRDGLCHWSGKVACLQTECAPCLAGRPPAR